MDTKEVGLEIGLVFLRYFLKTDYLHYGYFHDGLATDIQNLAPAQRAYVEFLFSHIPPGVKSILDVGCGSGRMAVDLLDRGYQVDVVSPGTLLTASVRPMMAGRGEVFNTLFERVETTKRYDLILFSESFQYIPMDVAFARAKALLNPGGAILVCDFFNIDTEGKSLLGGGHRIEAFELALETSGFLVTTMKDITRETAPTIDLVNSLSLEVLYPVALRITELTRRRFPMLARFVGWKWRKKLARLRTKHFSGQRTGANFIRYKSYRLILLQGSR